MEKLLHRGFSPDKWRDEVVVIDGVEHKGSWVEGYAAKVYSEVDDANITIIIPLDAQALEYEGLQFKEVLPETVGRYLELKDMNNVKVFEGDILEQVVIGNIYSNPERCPKEKGDAI